MAKLALHSQTRKLLERYAERPAHALLLEGETGVGLGTIAKQLASQLSSRAQLLLLEPDEKGTIGISLIHQLYSQTRSVRKNERLVVLIDDAEAMSQAAQNALLKLLEEPVDNVFFILTTHHLERLLATIRSRTAAIKVRELNDQDSAEFIGPMSDQKRQQLMFIAAGRPAELKRLVDDEELFEKKAAVVRDARTMLGGDRYERVKLAYAYEKSRPQSLELLGMMMNLLKFTTFQQRSVSAAVSAGAIERTAQALHQNGHLRTHLLLLATS